MAAATRHALTELPGCRSVIIRQKHISASGFDQGLLEVQAQLTHRVIVDTEDLCDQQPTEQRKF